MSKKMRIMHGLSEVAGQNCFSVLGLREIGEEAETVLWDIHPFHYPYDIILGIDKNNKLLRPLQVVKLACFLVKALLRYDVFHFHFGRSICNNFDLWAYDLLGKKYFYEFHGFDLRDYVKFGEISKYDASNDSPMTRHHLKRNEKICRRAKAIILHDDELIPYLPEIHAPVQVVPLRLDIQNFTPHYVDTKPEKIKIVHAPSNRSIKGTEYVLRAFEQLKQKYDNIELVLVEGKSQEEARRIYEQADILVDQLYIGTYGVFAIESMALGKPVITCISDEMKQCLPEELPIVSADIDNIAEVLESLILDGQLRRDLGIRGREYVENYHDYRTNAIMLRAIYEDSCEPAHGREAFERVRKIKNGR